ncbi:MAG: hypothetical protein IPK27_18610 [Rhodanobacteraceae bacterium]|nr:hypothetical protein [Rhodanobacteraceae bacterium]
MFRRLIASIALACALIGLAACEQAPPPPDPAASAPTNPADAVAWKTYVSAVVKKIVPADQSKRIFATFVEYGSDEAKTARHVENIKNFVGRGIAEGTLILFASPDSPLMATIVEQAFANPPKPDMLKSINVIFIGQKAEEERVKAAVGAWGASFTFYEAK